jgi:predicted metallo-beta-lactamase superfamily hydrolase
MLAKIKVTPLASESFGVRSMCTLVETPDCTVLLDAGISLAPYRFNLVPHPIEFQTIARLRQQIAQAANKAQVVTISHYHYDHHTPSYEDWLVNWTQNTETARQIYQNKTVLRKNPKENINASQRQRAWMFEKNSGRTAAKLEVADGKEFKFGETRVQVSEAVPHGPEDSSLGWVIMTTVEFEGERFMHAPDVQGPMAKHTLESILSQNPDVLMVGGPPFYLSGFKVNDRQVQQGTENLRTIVEAVPTTIIEHHALRDEHWRLNAQPIYTTATKAGHKVLTAAEYAGLPNVFLESKRRQLYEEHPPSEEFKQWMRLGGVKQSQIKPPT